MASRLMDERAPQGSGLERALAILARRRWLAIAAFVASMSGVIGLVPFLPNTYGASTVILVDRQKVPESFVRSTVTSALETRLQAISQEILSRVRLEALVQELGLYGELRRQESLGAAVDQMRRDIQLDLKSAPRTGQDEKLVAFTVRYLGDDPQTVARVANTLASYYLEENAKARGREASGTAEFLRRQLQEVKQRLEDQEQRLSAFKTRYLGETPQHMQENLTMLDRLNTQLKLNSERQVRALERREVLGRKIAEAESFANRGIEPVAPAAGSTPLPVMDPAARLSRLKQELSELRARFSDKYPDVVRARAEIAELERQLATTGETAEGPSGATGPAVAASKIAPPSPYLLQLRETIGEVEAELKALRVEEKRLHDDLIVYQRRIENTPRREQEYQTLSRDYGTVSDLYRTLLQRYEEAQLAETLEQRQKGEQFRILEAAIPPSAPSAPNRLRLVGIGLALSLGLAAGAMVLAELLDSSFHSVDEVRAFTAVPVLASIPRIRTGSDRRRDRWRFAVAASSTVLVAIVLAGTGLLIARGHVPLASGVAHAWLLRS